MKNATFVQAAHLLKLVEESGVPCSQLQDLFNSGLLSDLLMANISEIDRAKFRKLIGLVEKKLSKITSVQVSGAKRFVAKDCFKAANVGWTDNNFNQFFKEKVEENVAGITIAVYRLEKASLDVPILAELGDCAEIQLVHLFELIQKQSKGEAGVLLINSCFNIAYIKGNDGNLWAVDAYWDSCSGSWSVEAFSVEHPLRWYVGFQVLSRDS